MKNKKTHTSIILAASIAGAMLGNLGEQAIFSDSENNALDNCAIASPEVVEVPVTFEELSHRADSSLRTAFNLPGKAKNSDIVAAFKSLAVANKGLTEENAVLRQDNQRIVDAHNRLIKDNSSERQSTEVEKYYQRRSAEGS